MTGLLPRHFPGRYVSAGGHKYQVYKRGDKRLTIASIPAQVPGFNGRMEWTQLRTYQYRWDGTGWIRGGEYLTVWNE